MSARPLVGLAFYCGTHSSAWSLVCEKGSVMDSSPESDNSMMMPKHILNWKSVKVKSVRRSNTLCTFPAAIDLYLRGTLLSRILVMEKKRPIAFNEAIGLLKEKWSDELWVRQSGHEEWYQKNFVDWISGLGYHIEITGDEFEAVALSNKLAL